MKKTLEAVIDVKGEPNEHVGEGGCVWVDAWRHMRGWVCNMNTASSTWVRRARSVAVLVKFIIVITFFFSLSH